MNKATSWKIHDFINYVILKFKLKGFGSNLDQVNS
jgi:hypothetical protein